MSNFATGLAEHLPKFSAGLAGACLPAQDCALCAADAGDGLVCAACDAALRRMGPACERCALPLAPAGVCGQCRLRPLRFSRAVAAFEYRFPVDAMIRRFKYHADFALGRWLARRLADAVRGEARPDLLMAPPLTPARLRSRGFNQSLELAAAVGRELRLPRDAGALAKVRDTSPQPGLGRRARRANLRGAFRCRRDVRGLRVALVDDVLTTGATADAIAAELMAAGAAGVSVWAVARTPGPGD